MISFSATLMKFGQMGEKTGWTYIIVPKELAEKLKPGNKKITGTVTYMVCNDRQCLPPKDVEFKIKM